jgi:16S rRNA (cytosine967-C5)-methyltransferase
VAGLPATRARGGVSPARVCALRVIRRVFEEGAYADRAFAGEAAPLEPRDRALAMALSYGTAQRLATLDHVAGALLDGPLERLDPPVLAVVRLGLFELLYLGGAAPHAVVNESVELAKRCRPHAAGLVNAVLRRAAREGAGILARLDDASPAGAALAHSVPGWLASQWWGELGADTARALLQVVNQPAESALRVNALVARPMDVAAGLPVASRPAPGIPEGLVLDGPFDVQGSELWRSGAVQPQSRASMLVSRILAPEAGQRVLDLCAAPGGKTTHLAALMEDRGEIVAVERHPGRAAGLERTVARMRASCARVEVGDAAAPRAAGPFDRVLVDPPCSGLGTLQSRPDLRWRARPEAIGELAALQARILAAGAEVLAPGGVLVYSVCTISRAEGADVAEGFLREHGDFSADDLVAETPEPAGARASPGIQLLPHRDGTDGFFIARLRRR